MEAILKRKSIDLPTETLRILSSSARAERKSVKAYIESILIATAENSKKEKKESPSPSGDPWYDDEENVAMLKAAIAESKRSEGREYTMEEIHTALGL